MQNKPNLLDAPMNVTSLYTKDCENKRLADMANTKPIQTQYKANTNPIQSQYKPNTKPIQTQFPKSQNERNFYFNKGL